MRRALAAALTLAACAPAPVSKEEPRLPSQSLPAPTPEDVDVRIGAAQNGQTVEVQVNRRFAIELIGVPTAGYVWGPSQVPPFVTRAGEATGNLLREQGNPGYAGGNHWEVLMFAATGPGTGEIVLEQRRPWESGEPPADSFRVAIVAR